MYNEHFHVTAEMQKLRDWLTERGIDWHDESEPEFAEVWMCRTHFQVKDVSFSVIHGVCSYGGICRYSNEDPGLLELACSLFSDVEGGLTADAIIRLITGVQNGTCPPDWQPLQLPDDN